MEEKDIEKIIKKNGGSLDIEKIAKKHGGKVDIDKLAHRMGADISGEYLLKKIENLENKKQPKEIDEKELEKRILDKLPKPKPDRIIEKTHEIRISEAVPKITKRMDIMEGSMKDFFKRLSHQNSSQTTSFGGEITKLTQLTDDVKITSPTDNQVLSYDSATSKWINETASITSPGGANTNIQYNDAGSFGGDANFIWNKNTQVFTTIGTIVITDPSLGNSATFVTSSLTGNHNYTFPDISGTFAVVPGSDTQVVFNDGGALGADSGFVFNKTTNVITLGGDFHFDVGAARSINVIDQTTTNAGGETLTVAAGKGNGTGSGGTLTVTGGANGGANSNGSSIVMAGGSDTDAGILTLQAGNFTGNGAAGSVNIYAGSPSAGNNDGGSITLSPGTKSGSGALGRIIFQDAESLINAIFDTSSLASSNKTFAFPNQSGTFALVTDTYAFGTIAVSGQSNIVADTSSDTLTISQVSGVYLTTDATTDTLSIEANTSPGIKHYWSTSTTDADPGVGYVGQNNSTFGSITKLFISKYDIGNNDISTEIMSWDDYGNQTIRGRLYIFRYQTEAGSPVHWESYWLNGTNVSNTGYITLNVTPITSLGVFNANDPVFVVFMPAGPFFSRTTSVADGTSISVNADNFEQVNQTNTQAAGTLTINNPTGTPFDGQRLTYVIKCTNAQTFSFGTSFAGSSDLALPTTSTGSSKIDYLGFTYSTINSKFNYVAKTFGF